MSAAQLQLQIAALALGRGGGTTTNNAVVVLDPSWMGLVGATDTEIAAATAAAAAATQIVPTHPQRPVAIEDWEGAPVQVAMHLAGS